VISISSPGFDITGPVESQAGYAVAQNISRRARRVPTLDGSAVLVDAGYAVADLIIDVSAPDSDGSVYLGLLRLMAANSKLVLSCSYGCYLVSLSGLQNSRGETTCVAEVLEDLG